MKASSLSKALLFRVAGVVLLIVCAPCSVFADSGSFIEIQRAFFRRDFNLVEEQAKDFFKLEDSANEEKAQVRLWLAISLHQEGQTQQALEQLSLIGQSLDKDSVLWPELLFWEAEMARLIEDYPRARAVYQRVIRREPYSSWATYSRLGLGMVFTHYEQYDVAGKYFRGVVQEQEFTQTGRQAKLYAGFSALKLKEYWDAIRLLKSLLASSSDSELNARASLYLGEALNGLKMTDKALEAYGQAVAYAPESQWAQLGRFAQGWVYFQKGLCDEAGPYFNEYLKSRDASHEAEALFANASCALRSGERDLAIAGFRRLMVQQPNHPLAMEAGVLWSDDLIRRDALKEAYEVLNNVAAASKDATLSDKAALQKGLLAFELGNTLEARSLLHQVTQSEDELLRQMAWNALGDVAMWTGSQNEAESFYRQSLENGPDPALKNQARLQLARLLLQKGETKEARALIEALRFSGDPLHADSRILEALIKVEEGNIEAAEAIWDSLYSTYQEKVEAGKAAYYLALLAFDQERYDQAVQRVQESIAWAPKSDEALDARLVAAELRLRDQDPATVFAWLREEFEATTQASRRYRVRMAMQLGAFAQQQQQYAEAIRYFEDAVDLAPEDSGAALYASAGCYEDGGDEDIAIQRYRSIEHDPWMVRGQLSAARLFERRGNLVAVRGIYEHLLELSVPEKQIIEERLEVLNQQLAYGENYD